MSENTRFRAGLIVKLALTIVVAGVLVAGLLLPWVGGTGLVARNAATLLHALPGELTDKPPAGATRVLAADGSLITNFYANDRTPVKSDQIAPIMKQALVDIEDIRFYEHNGVDVQGTVRALITNVAAGTVREGGSTLTQQLVKQTLLQTATSATERNAAADRSRAGGVSRKLKEARLALALEQQYSKDEILTKYLNIVYFGEGAYGIEAAAHRYFSTHAGEAHAPPGLDAGRPGAEPVGRRPDREPRERDGPPQPGARADEDPRAHLRQGRRAIEATKVKVKPGASPPNGCIDAALGGFFCSYVYDYVTGEARPHPEPARHRRPDHPDDAGPQAAALGRPGRARTTCRWVTSSPRVLDAVQPGTGHVLAMARTAASAATARPASR